MSNSHQARIKSIADADRSNNGFGGSSSAVGEISARSRHVSLVVLPITRLSTLAPIQSPGRLTKFQTILPIRHLGSLAGDHQAVLFVADSSLHCPKQP